MHGQNTCLDSLNDQNPAFVIVVLLFLFITLYGVIAAVNLLMILRYNLRYFTASVTAIEQTVIKMTYFGKPGN